MRLNKRGQSTLEYAILISIVIAALVAIQIYMKRGVQGRLRQASDDIGEQFDANKTTSSYTTGRTGKTIEVTTAGVTNTYAGAAYHPNATDEVVTRSGNETVDAW